MIFKQLVLAVSTTFASSILKRSKETELYLITDPSQFPQINTNHRTIHFQGSAITELPKDLSFAKSLKRLIVENTSIAEIPPIKNPDISEIIIKGNKKLIAFIADLRKLNKLTALDLSDNNLRYLGKDFGEMKALKEINLENNCLNMIPDFFKSCPKLRNVNLRGNKLTAIPKSVLNLKKLETLNLEGNPLKCMALTKSDSLIGWLELLRKPKCTPILDNVDEKLEYSSILSNSFEKYGMWNFKSLCLIKNTRISIKNSLDHELAYYLKTLFSTVTNNQSTIETALRQMVGDSKIRFKEDDVFEETYKALVMHIFVEIFVLKNQGHVQKAESLIREVLAKLESDKRNSILILRHLIDKMSIIDTRIESSSNLLQYLILVKRINSGLRTFRAYPQTLVDSDVNKRASLQGISSPMEDTVWIESEERGFENDPLVSKTASIIYGLLLQFKIDCLHELVIKFADPVEEFTVFEYYRMILDEFVGFDSLFCDKMTCLLDGYEKSPKTVLMKFLDKFTVRRFIEGALREINHIDEFLVIFREFIKKYFKNPPKKILDVNSKLDQNAIRNILSSLGFITVNGIEHMEF